MPTKPPGDFTDYSVEFNKVRQLAQQGIHIEAPAKLLQPQLNRVHFLSFYWSDVAISLESAVQ
jgi:hypothetical protein